ncbi:MAG: hypothetical protein ACOC2W_02885 [bacterium]
MKLFKLDIKMDGDCFILNSMTAAEKFDIYSRKVITEINRNYNKLFLDNYSSLKIFVNYIFASDYIMGIQFFNFNSISNDSYVGQLSGKPLHILNHLKDDEYFIGKSEGEYEIYLRKQKINKIKQNYES